jgi:hypothetical protein
VGVQEMPPGMPWPQEMMGATREGSSSAGENTAVNSTRNKSATLKDAWRIRLILPCKIPAMNT